MTTPPGTGPTSPYPAQPPSGYPGPYPGVPPRPPRSTRGATVLVVVGAALLVVALVAGVLGVTTFVRALPTGVVDGAGEPGSAALASGDVPGEAEIALVGGEPYSVWAVVPIGAEGFDADDVTVSCPDGDLQVRHPSVSGSSGFGSYEATTVAEVSSPSAETCTVSVAQGDASPGATFVITEGWRFGEFFATVGGTILLWFVAIGGTLLGLGLLVGGIVWRLVARRP
ncbi:hypothetical protein [Cellulosimicrobium protaetiae]|uniref:Uncharacterized protein n=1 Tax=Cellulosimicrobium protaetiae TaxID=2587808 RepID=A0A6M5UID5_9MICO|nr:hypothetical protein [Cellulosimicrobium protaetiae]QJW36888.1 hypothetical protein FIC82_012485 [Cellulosimicrobium protaetiae]